MKSARLTNAEKQARYRERQRLAPLRTAMGLEPITLHLTPDMRERVLELVRDAADADHDDAERRAIIIEAMTSE